jgi:hypothetical protein
MTLIQSKMLLSSTAMEACWEWYTSGPRQRLQPGGAIILSYDSLVFNRSNSKAY